MIQPSRDIVLIKVDQPKEKTESGLYLAKEEWKTLPPTGEVVAVGPEVEGFEIGEKVVFERYASVILEDNMRLCKATHILAKING